MADGLLSGRRVLVQGVANERSLCWGIARACHQAGAELCLTYQNERYRDHVEPLAAQLPGTFTAPLELQQDGEIAALAEILRERWGKLDAVVHGAAFARQEDLRGEFVETTRDGFLLAMEVSAYSLVALARATRPLLRAAGGGSIVCLTYVGSTRVTPNYNVMGVAKAALEASVRYLANDLGPDGIRVNAISAGPVRTLASSAVRGVREHIAEVRDRSPLRHPTDQAEVGDAAVYLASPMARGTTGQVLFVDSGHHILGA
jgi:enoyl-[acyl-carrier protein] reductase I